MIVKQYYLGCLSHASYLIVDEESKQAVVVDPQRDIEQYLEDAKSAGAEIRYVFLTHFHADFLAGHVEMRDRIGAEICMGSRAEAEFAFRRFGDGDTLTLGSVELGILETPGHTPEGISITVTDRSAGGDKPYAVLTGDALFIGDVGRPDLMASIGVSAEELAGMLFDSLHDKLLQLPDETLVYPAHGAGSLCGKSLSKETVSTIGDQRKYNYALQPMSREEFINLITADQPEAPSYFAYDAELNRRERPTLDKTLEQSLQPLSLEEVLRLQEEGAQVLDTRNAMDFESGHLRGSLQIGLGGQYATWSGTLLDRERPIVLITDPGAEEESAMRLGRIGFDHVRGYLEGGVSALVSEPQLVSQVSRMTARDLAEMRGAAAPVTVVDVRSPGERASGHIENSLAIPLGHLRKRVSEIPRGRPVVVQCASGYRSAMGCSILRQEGFEDVYDLVGGIKGWEASQLEVVTS